MNLTYPLEKKVKRPVYVYFQVRSTPFFLWQYQSCINDHQCFFKPFSSVSPYLVKSANKSFIFNKHNHVDNFTILSLLLGPLFSKFLLPCLNACSPWVQLCVNLRHSLETVEIVRVPRKLWTFTSALAEFPGGEGTPIWRDCSSEILRRNPMRCPQDGFVGVA